MKKIINPISPLKNGSLSPLTFCNLSIQIQLVPLDNFD